MYIHIHTYIFIFIHVNNASLMHCICIYVYHIVIRQRARSRDQSIVRSCERASQRLRNLHLRYKSRNLDNDLCATVTTASHVRSQGIHAAWRETHACTHLGVHMHMTRICVRAIGKLCVNGAHAGRVKERVCLGPVMCRPTIIAAVNLSILQAKTYIYML